MRIFHTDTHNPEASMDYFNSIGNEIRCNTINDKEGNY